MIFHRSRHGVLIGLVTIVAACASRSNGPSVSPAPPAAGATQAARQTHENLNAVLWMQTAAEYRASTMQAYRLAQLQLDTALGDPAWTAATEQTGDVSSLPPAVILDLDETVIDNSAFQARQVQDASAYSEEAWNRWVEERKSGAIPGAIEFLAYAKSRGVTPFYVTNRDHKVEDATRDVLAKLGVPVTAERDAVLTRHESGWDGSDKSSRRQSVAANYRVLLVVGDNFEDFVSGTRASVTDRAALMQKYEAFWGRKWIVLPNPTYGSWDGALTFGMTQPSDDQTLAAKYHALKTER
ncbi:MAG: 5'-nucleotidase, lipoprotein e(P4) family [Acidobacteria bacterium]|nr:MAG: 5'-nucleotidase, lipoprotein e(P4) family [Acidobacteriota bacterium]